MDFWRIPGPARFVAAISDAVIDGRITFVHIPQHAPTGLAEELRERLGFCNELLEPDQDLLLHLEAMLSEEERAEALQLDIQFIASKLADRIIWVESTLPNISSPFEACLIPFGEAARHSPNGGYPRFLILLFGNAATRNRATNHASVAHFSWDSYVEPVDMLLYSTYSVRNAQDWKTRLSARILSELACYDPEVVSYLSAFPEDTLMDPKSQLFIFGKLRGWQGLPSWNDGSISQLNGRDEVHSGHPDCTEVTYRIWRAQVSELFPILEIRRMETAKLFEQHLYLPMDDERRQYNSVLELEFTEIIRQLNSSMFIGRIISRSELSTLRRWRHLRNKLAHGDTLIWDDLRDDLFRPLR
jgi:hypothetical protein